MNRLILPMNGGINKDVNQLYIDSEKGEVLNRKNCRVTAMRGSVKGINTSVNGMTQIDYASVDGTNKVIGFVEDKERDRGVFFVYNSIGNHDIYRIQGATITPLYADADVLSFDIDEKVDADILGDYCVFVSDYNPPRKINITESLNGKDGYDIQLAVRPPSEKPQTILGSDSSRVVNKLVGKTFQFATMYIYKDYTYSVLSPYSDIVVSNAAFSASYNTFVNNAIGNYVQVTYDLGGSDVLATRLLAREGNIGSWFVVEEYEVNGAGGNRVYSFYNDVAKQALVETEAVSLYSDVPRRARSVKAVQNRIALGNVLKGYDRTTPDFSLGVEYETVSVSGSTVELSSTEGLMTPLDAQSGYAVAWDLPSTYAVNNEISIQFNGGYYQELAAYQDFCDFNFEYSYTTTVTQADMDSGSPELAISNRMLSDINSKGADIITVNRGAWRPDFEFYVGGNQGVLSKDIGIVFLPVFDSSGNDGGVGGTGSYYSFYKGSFSSDVVPEGVNTYKSGSYYNAVLLGYDEYGRTSGGLSSQKIYIPHAGERDFENAFDRARITFLIPDATSGVSSWMKYYRFAITESVNFVGVYPFTVGNDTDSNIVETFLDGKSVMAINMPTNMQYEFAKGDFLHLELLDAYPRSTATEISDTIVKNVIGTRTIIDIDGTDTAGFWLIIPKGDEDISTYDGHLCSIYRGKNEVSDLIYFEDSTTYNISSGEMQTLSGYVGAGDAWFVSRNFEWDGSPVNEVSETVEDFYINVDDATRAYSKGRVVVEFETLGEITLQDFVWSNAYLDNTKINGISTFNSTNREQLDEKDGQIQRIELVGDVIKVIQDNKETSMYIGKSQISDASGNLQVVLSSDFIGAKNPSEDDYGSRYPFSIVQNDRNLYYFDGDKGVVVRSSPNGQVAISAYGMQSEFLRIGTTASEIFAVFDDRNEEYLITFVVDGVPETWSFKEGANMWNSEWEYSLNGASADLYGSVGSQVYSFGFGYAWKHEASSTHNTFYGSFKPLSITAVVNVAPMGEKALRAIETDSNRGLNTIITSPITNTATVGMKTVLYPATYRSRRGVFTSPINKNILGAGGAEIMSLYFTGEDMTGHYFEIEFNDDSNEECQLRNATVSYTQNF